MGYSGFATPKTNHDTYIQKGGCGIKLVKNGGNPSLRGSKGNGRSNANKLGALCLLHVRQSVACSHFLSPTLPPSRSTREDLGTRPWGRPTVGS
jgi:hypothetical protein